MRSSPAASITSSRCRASQAAAISTPERCAGRCASRRRSRARRSRRCSTGCSATVCRDRSPRRDRAISPSFPAAGCFRRRSPTSSPTRRTAIPGSGRRRRRWCSSRRTRSTGCGSGWRFRPRRAGCSPPADRWRPGTPFSARASGTSARTSGRACSTCPTRRITR